MGPPHRETLPPAVRGATDAVAREGGAGGLNLPGLGQPCAAAGHRSRHSAPAPSSSSRRALTSRPPANPVSAPLDPTTRWQGATIDTGFLPFAAPTARAAPGLPICLAICP